MKRLQILVLGSMLAFAAGCVADGASADDETAPTSETEQAVSGWYRVRWSVAGLYDTASCSSVQKTFHSGHHVYVHYTFVQPPECGSNETWAYVSDNYGNVGIMRFASLW